ncbi:DUF418 domain-containing protein [Nocardiopsis sp. NPDC050513]|uniref:DUF418 domain-containing protein n=1 Tax=Nocardiopsis sp. NPDC050513 TaxID=3364338 RepID=UPI0037A317E3
MAVTDAVDTSREPERARASGRRPRVAGVDVARGLAILGVFIAHMGVPLTAFLAPAADGTDPAAYVDYATEGFGGIVVSWVGTAVSGRSAALFSFLAGLSLVLVAGRTRPGRREDRNRVRVKVAVRAILLIALGYALATLGSLAVILHFYGLFFLLAIPLLWLRIRHLLVVGAAVLLIGPQVALYPYVSEYLPWNEGGYSSGTATEWEVASDAEWDSMGEEKWDDPAWVAEQEATWEEEPAGMPLFDVSLLETPLDLLVLGIYPAVVFMAYVIAGMVVGRLDLRALRTRLWLLGGGVATAVAGYGTSWLLVHPFSGVLPGGDYLYSELFASYSHSNTTLEVVGNTGVAVAVLGLCLLVADRARVLVYPLAAAGAMTLTLYTAHGIGLWALFHVPSEAEWAEFLATYTVEIFFLVALVGAPLWRRFLGAGPMERPLTWTANTVSRRLIRTRAAASHGVGNPSGPDGGPGGDAPSGDR